MRGSKVLTTAVLLVLFAGVIGLQMVRERMAPLALPKGASGNLLYVRSADFMKRAALSYDSLLADVYWVRAVQHYGRTKLSSNPDKQYDLLYPLLDLTTSLDPQFNVAYRFGSIFLAEPPPAGPGRPDQAVALLTKGLKQQPTRWEFAQDIGFVYYWWFRDYQRAADWFTRASRFPDAPSWMAPLAAVSLAEGGSLATSRQLWLRIMRDASPEEEWIRAQGELRLRQIDALELIDRLEERVKQYETKVGELPATWEDMVRTGFLRAIPLDSDRKPFQLNPYWGLVTLDPSSSLNPLPARTTPTEKAR
jgi:hypothetical protein